MSGISVDSKGVVRVAGWEKYGWLRHGFSTREGEVSEVYGGKSLNLGWTAEDEAGLVTENRQRFVGAICGGLLDKTGHFASDARASDEPRLVTVRQVHGDVVQVVREGAVEGLLQTPEGKAVLVGDGLMTDLPGVLVGVQTADCVPVLLVDVRRRAMAAIHAGWRGTLARIVEKGVAGMREAYGSQVEDLVAAVGPSIGGCCYSVGEEVRAGFEGEFGYGASLFEARGGEVFLDLWEANRRQLLEAGVSDVSVVGECTACARVKGERKYFSHRAEMGVTGRMLSVVGEGSW